jgi:ribosomal protein S18 acetylase RimI-like enzyme
MTEVLHLAPSHCAAVAELHLAFLRTRFAGLPGRRLLEVYYRALVAGRGGRGYVAVAGSSVVGYVCGIWDASALYRSMLRRGWPRLVIWGIAQLAVRPSLVGSLLARGSAAGRQNDGLEAGYELRPIVVTPSARGTGVALELVDRLLADASAQGYPRVHLVTEADNVAAQHFYRKAGFTNTGTLFRSGETFLRFARASERVV